MSVENGPESVIPEQNRPASLAVRATTPEDKALVESVVSERWGGATVAVHDAVYRPSELPGFWALSSHRPVGLVTYRIEGSACEIVTLDALAPRKGVGTALVEAVAAKARAAGCQRLWLITTNDNLDALRFYLRRGFRLAAVHPGAVDRARLLKPAIPKVGDYGIPMHDELELERRV